MPGKTDRLLEIGSTPDWFSPLIALVQDFLNGDRQRFYVDRKAGFSVSQIKRLLKRNRIHFWGDMITDGMIIFTVSKSEAGRVQELFQRSGIPFL